MFKLKPKRKVTRCISCLSPTQYPPKQRLLTYGLQWLFLVLVKQLAAAESSVAAHLMGPIFIDEPPSRTHFSNTTGAVITCSATSTMPPVKIWWLQADGQTVVTDVAGLRYVRPNGQLVFPPFSLAQYRQDVHLTTYRCMASNSLGFIIRSRDCEVKAVVHQAYKMQVYDEFVIRENTAIMRCQVPSIVREYVRVVAWLRDEQVLVTATHNPHSGRHSILSTGELLIRNTSFADGGSYRCQTRHQLTDELRTSEEAGRLVVTEPHNEVAPRVWAHTSVRCEQNTVCELTCVAHSWPLSTYRWYRESETGVYMSANLYSNVEIRESNSLLLRPATAALHEGQWICVANNTITEEKVVIRVQVISPLEVAIEPRQAQVDAGRSFDLNCSIKGGPPVKQPVWYHNSKPIIDIIREHSHDQRIRLLEPHILHISSVRREDIGVYQCFVESEFQQSQASAELKLGDVAPILMEMFQERQVIESGSSISLRCSAIGTPMPQIRWFLDDQPIPNLARFREGDHVTNDGKVVSFANISKVRVIDGGEYSCVAANEVGKAAFKGQVLVTGGPNLRTTFWGHHNLSVVAGLDTVVRCPVIAYPIESVAWEHNGNVLPTNHRQSIDSIVDGYGGTLRIKDVHSAQDAGEYVCSVRVANTENERPVRGAVQMNVHFAPKIDRHTLPTHLSAKQGERIKLMCSVIEGDQPIAIQWKRNGRQVKSSELISIQNGEDYSLLTFKSMLISDSDHWTCQAKNEFASDNSSIEIVVNVPPKWTIEPKNVQIILSKSITINCQAEGYPKPKIVWKKSLSVVSFSAADSMLEDKSSSSQSHEFRDILSSYRYQVFSNGSLYLQEVELTDAGLYMCQVSNGIGTDLSKVIQVLVQQPPRVATKFASESVVRGATATLQCRAEGDPVLRAEWNRDMQPIDTSQHQRYVIKEDSSARGSIISYLEILDTRRLDSALFTCVIANSFGTDSTNIQLIVQEIPEPPRDVSVNEITSRSVKVRWKPSFAGNNAVVGFILEYRAKCFEPTNLHHNSLHNSKHATEINPWDTNMKDSTMITAAKWTDFFINDPNAQSFVLRDLYPWCPYELQMRAKNSIGISDASQLSIFRTAEEMPGGPPLEVSVEPLSSNSLKIKWKPPDKHLQYGLLKGYYIGYRLVEAGRFAGSASDGGSEQFAYKNVEASSPDSAAFEVAYLTNLKKHTMYLIVVQAFNSAGAGPRSDEITVRTLNVQKQNTLVLEVVTTDSSSITLHWEIDGADSSAQNGFVLHISEEGSGDWLERSLAAHLRRHVESGLKCGTKYLLYMSQRDKTTTGEMITARTKGTVAISPSVDEFLAANSTAVALNFNSWHNGGCPIRNYSIKYRSSHHKHWKVIGTIKFESYHGPQRPFVLGDLEPNREYVLSVIATSSAGMTEAVYNFTTWNESAMIVRLTRPDIASSEYSSNAPFHNVTIMLPIVISILVLVAVLCTLFAFMRKQDLHEPREFRLNSAPNLQNRLRSTSVRSKEDINEMLTFPMSDYHSLCTTNTASSKGKLCDGVATGRSHYSGNEPLYGKPHMADGGGGGGGACLTLQYSSPKRSTIRCDNGDMAHQLQQRSTRVTVNSHHIYAEPNPSLLQQCGVTPRCLLANMVSTDDACLLDTGATVTADVTELPSNESFRALINSSTNAHI